MIQKIKQWLKNRKLRKVSRQLGSEGVDVYTREQVEKVYYLGYNDGKRDGLSIAREQATRSLREILKSQNKGK